MRISVQPKYKLLVVDDEPYAIRLIKKYCQQLAAIDCYEASSPAEALSWAGSNSFDIALIDYKMPNINGVELARKLRELHPGSFYIIVTAYGELDKAVEAMRAGIFDFLTKPLELDEFELAMERVMKNLDLKRQNSLLKEYLKESSGKGKLLGTSSETGAIREKIERFASYDAPVLITGETGVGKEVVARMIHERCARNESSYVAVNCSAFSESLLESEMFGHEKGAFTGADNRRIGRLELAGDGTVLLDELCDIDPATQVKLLRVLQEKEFERVGGNGTIKLNARILSATNKNVQEEIKNRRFREDLYYRLNTLHIHIPPLRDRREDIVELADHFLRKFSIIHGKETLSFSERTLDTLQAYPWPGNVRQLQNSVEHMVIECGAESIEPRHLPPDIFDGAPILKSRQNHVQQSQNRDQVKIPELIGEIERESIIAGLEKNRWNKSRTAMELGLTLAKLIYRMKKYDIN